MELAQSSETSAFNTQTPGKYPLDNLALLQHGESLKTSLHSIICVCVFCTPYRHLRKRGIVVHVTVMEGFTIIFSA
jgi:hypothetical protein